MKLEKLRLRIVLKPQSFHPPSSLRPRETAQKQSLVHLIHESITRSFLLQSARGTRTVPLLSSTVVRRMTAAGSSSATSGPSWSRTRRNIRMTLSSMMITMDSTLMIIFHSSREINKIVIFDQNFEIFL